MIDPNGIPNPYRTTRRRQRPLLITRLMAWYWPAMVATWAVCLVILVNSGLEHDGAASVIALTALAYVTLAALARQGGDDRWL